jgi:hypothetical protein
MTLLDDLPPTFLCRRCPRCRRRRGAAYRCRHCGASLATEEQWAWAWQWAGQNLGLLRTVYGKVRPDLARTMDDAELLSECIAGIVRGMLGWQPGAGTKLGTFLANSVRFAAMKAPRVEETQGVEVR